MLSAGDKRAKAFFFRTSDSHEVDLILDWGIERWAVEIKLTSNPGTVDISRLNRAADMLEAEKRCLVCRIASDIENASLLVTNVSGWLNRLSSKKTP